MLKIKMVGRFTGISGRKLEQGLTYSFPRDYAEELIKHGHAVDVTPAPIPPPEPEPELEPIEEEKPKVTPKKRSKKPWQLSD